MRILHILLLLSLTWACTNQPSKPRLPYFKGPAMEPEWIIPGDDINGFNRVQDYSLQDQNNHSFSGNEDTLHIRIAHFFKLPCQGPCPVLSRTMLDLQEHYGNDPEVQLLSFAYPEKDSTSTGWDNYLQRYKTRSGKWYVLRGTEEDMTGLIQAMPEMYSAGKEVIPSFENLYLLDKHGFIRWIYPMDNPTELENLYLDVNIQKKAH